MGPLTENEAALLLSDGTFDYVNLLEVLMVDSIFWGINSTLFAYAIYSLSQREQKTKAWAAILIVLTVMFVLNTTIIAGNCFSVFQQIDQVYLSNEPDYAKRLDSDKKVYPVIDMTDTVFSLEFIIGDLIVIWRMWVLWKHSLVRWFPILLWIGSLGMFIAERIFTLDYSNGRAGTDPGDFTVITRITNLTSFGLSLACNGVCTIMIAYRAWNFIRSRAGLALYRKSRVSTILLLIAELGVIYLGLWLIETTFQIRTDLFVHRPLSTFEAFFQVFSIITSQLSAMYPACVVIVLEVTRFIDGYDTTEDRHDSLPSLPASASSVDVVSSHWSGHPQSFRADTSEITGSEYSKVGSSDEAHVY